MSARLFVNSADTYTGEVNRITYTFTRLSDNQTATYIDGGSNTGLTGFYDDYLTLTHGSPNGIKINADSAMPTGDDLLYYTLTATILFKSGVSRTATANIIVSDDSTAIVMSSQSVMFNVINAAWTAQYGSAIGRNNFFKVDLMSLTGTLDFSTAGSNLSNLLTANGSYLFRYLSNLTGLNLDGCTNITNVNSNITQIDFTYMTALQNLSIQNCTGLTGNIDITMCTDIRQVDSSGTTVSIIMPTEPKVTKYEVGKPTTISIVNPTVLDPENVKVDGYDNLTSLVLKNIPNTKTYRTFAKIMKSLGAEVLLNTIINNNHELAYNSAWNCTSEMYLPAGTSVTCSQSCYIHQYGDDDSYLRGFEANAGTSYTVDQYVNGYAYIRVTFSSTYTSFTVTNSSTGQILLKYEK